MRRLAVVAAVMLVPAACGESEQKPAPYRTAPCLVEPQPGAPSVECGMREIEAFTKQAAAGDWQVARDFALYRMRHAQEDKLTLDLLKQWSASDAAGALMLAVVARKSCARADRELAVARLRRFRATGEFAKLDAQKKFAFEGILTEIQVGLPVEDPHCVNFK